MAPLGNHCSVLGLGGWALPISDASGVTNGGEAYSERLSLLLESYYRVFNAGFARTQFKSSGRATTGYEPGTEAISLQSASCCDFDPAEWRSPSTSENNFEAIKSTTLPFL